MIILQPDDIPQFKENGNGKKERNDDDKWVILTVQPRVPAGGLQFVELPAGMVDGGTFGGSAAKEIREELGIEIPESELINLTELAIPPSRSSSFSSNNPSSSVESFPRAMYPSPGGCDEYIPIFLHEKRVPRETLKEWTGKLTGLRDEGEKITLKLVRLENLWWEGARDGKALGAVALWEGLRRAGRL